MAYRPPDAFNRDLQYRQRLWPWNRWALFESEPTAQKRTTITTKTTITVLIGDQYAIGIGRWGLILMESLCFALQDANLTRAATSGMVIPVGVAPF